MNARWPRFPGWPRVRTVRVPWPHTRRGRRGALAAIAFVLLSLLWLCSGGRDDGRATWPRRQILDAIRFVESGDRDDAADGDDGKAIGPYQIHRVYWEDALRAQPSLGGDYQDCRSRAYAERVIAAYMQRWVPEAWHDGDAEILARVHNGGPTGPDKQATLRYWERVRARLP